MAFVQPLEFISDALSALATFLLLLALKQQSHMPRGAEKIPKGVSSTQLWFSLAARLAKHGRLFVDGKRVAAACTTLAAAFKDSWNGQSIPEASQIFLNVFTLDGHFHRVVTQLFAVVSALTLVACLPFTALNPLSCCRRYTDAAAKRTNAAKKGGETPPTNTARVPHRETFPLATTLVIVCTSACCALASTNQTSVPATKYGMLKLLSAFTKFAGIFLELAAIRMLVSAWCRQRSGFFVVHSILFRALAVMVLLANMQVTGKLLKPAPTAVGVIAPLMSARLLPLVQRASLVCAVLLYIPFLYCYARFQWKLILLLAVMGATTAFWLPLIGIEPAALDQTLSWQWSTAFEGTGKMDGMPPAWCAIPAMFQVVAMVWTMGFAGRVGLCMSTLVASIISRVVQAHV